jgi:hypothetical protein
MESKLVVVRNRKVAALSGPVVPALVAASGTDAAMRFLNFFATHVDGGLNPRINGAGQNIGTEFAVIPPEQKDWTVSPLSTPLAARGGGRRPAFTGG